MSTIPKIARGRALFSLDSDFEDYPIKIFFPYTVYLKI